MDGYQPGVDGYQPDVDGYQPGVDGYPWSVWVLVGGFGVSLRRRKRQYHERDITDGQPPPYCSPPDARDRQTEGQTPPAGGAGAGPCGGRRPPPCHSLDTHKKKKLPKPNSVLRREPPAASSPDGLAKLCTPDVCKVFVKLLNYMSARHEYRSVLLRAVWW